MVLNIMACVKHERRHMGRASCFPCVTLLVGLVLTYDSYADLQSSVDQAASGVLWTTKGHACPPEASLTHGRAVYLRNCQACHGICGDGNGDYAPTLRIKPRDFTADRKSTRLNSSHGYISYAVFCLKKKKHIHSMNSVL